ncbi:MAG: DUF3298 domain-containing protein [Muribaculaceae bacterium]|nr:DUF3298 domain-containing protein [Muribaculaceae bacterium]
MKHTFMILAMAVVGVLASMDVGAAPYVDDSASKTPIDLFLGMDYDDDYSYTGSESLLYRFPGLIMQEKDATWYVSDDDFDIKFRCSLGLYIDKEYPSEAVFRELEAAIDSALVFGLEPYGGMDDQPAFRLRSASTPQNAKQILEFGSQVFDMYTKQMSAKKPVSAYEQVPEARWCLVVHKLYDEGDQATYLFEISYDINGSNGCPSQAHFITFDKKTGEILQPDEIINKYGAEYLKSQLWDAYMKVRAEREYGDDVTAVSPDELISEVSGCAIINEGIMFYYLPYIIGCGAEGEYNLVIPKK